MEKHFGVSDVDLERVMDKYVLKQGDTVDVGRLREGLKVLIQENNEALLESVKELIKNSK